MEQQVILEPIAQQQAAVLQNMVELYAHDFSEHVPLDLKPNGRFDVSIGDLWWTAVGHYPFFIRWHGKLVGFALVRRGSRVTAATEVMDVAEFFVIRGARGRGIGTSAAHALFGAFPGAWEMRVRRTNVAAMKFWSRSVEAWTGRPAHGISFSADGVDWNVVRMISADRPGPTAGE
jgi:predicted acetyltransferase